MSKILTASYLRTLQGLSPAEKFFRLNIRERLKYTALDTNETSYTAYMFEGPDTLLDLEESKAVQTYVKSLGYGVDLYEEEDDGEPVFKLEIRW